MTTNWDGTAGPDRETRNCVGRRHMRWLWEEVPATALSMELHYRGDSVTDFRPLCRKCAGSVKARITRGSYGSNRLRVVDDVTDFSEGNLDRLADEWLRERRDNERAASKARAEYIERTRADEERAYREPSEYRLGYTEPDDWGHRLVHLPTYPTKLTPGQARGLAKALIEASDELWGDGHPELA